MCISGNNNKKCKILVVGNDIFEWYAPAWAKAMSMLGDNVVLFSFRSLFSKGLLGRIERRYLVGPAIKRINAAVLEKADKFEPEIVLLYAAMPIRPDTVKKLASKYWVTTYHNDNPFGSNGEKAYWRYFKASIPFACSHHVFRISNVEDYKCLGSARVNVLQSSYLPWCDKPPSLSDKEKALFAQDVVFVGHGAKDKRIVYIQMLVNSGIQLKIYGYDKYWRRNLPPNIYKRLLPIDVIYGENYRRVIAASKICLCFLSFANRDEYTQRVFEIPAVGGFLLCERTPVMQSLYEEDKEAVYFSTPLELVEKCRYYLLHDEIRLQIADAGHRRCISSGYDIVSRMKQWKSDVMNWKSNAFTNKIINKS